jgi:hypothetical protein
MTSTTCSPGSPASLELLKARVSQGRIGDLDRFITAAHGAALRAASLTHRLLAFARRQALDPKQISANSLIASMLEMVRRTVGPGITVDTTLMSGLWPNLCDPHQLENAILNLCINARDAMPDGGQLTMVPLQCRPGLCQSGMIPQISGRFQRPAATASLSLGDLVIVPPPRLPPNCDAMTERCVPRMPPVSGISGRLSDRLMDLVGQVKRLAPVDHRNPNAYGVTNPSCQRRSRRWPGMRR